MNPTDPNNPTPPAGSTSQPDLGSTFAPPPQAPAEQPIPTYNPPASSAPMMGGSALPDPSTTPVMPANSIPSGLSDISQTAPATSSLETPVAAGSIPMAPTFDPNQAPAPMAPSSMSSQPAAPIPADPMQIQVPPPTPSMDSAQPAVPTWPSPNPTPAITSDPMAGGMPTTTPTEQPQTFGSPTTDQTMGMGAMPGADPMQPTSPTPTFVPPGGGQMAQNSPENMDPNGGVSGFNWSNPGGSAAPQPVTATAYDPSQPGSVMPQQSTEPAPTDLSHLVSNAGGDSSVYVPPISQPETLVTPPGDSTEMPNVPTENHSKGIPKWAIGVGVALLLIVVAASAYLILGIGRNTTPPASAPATQTPDQSTLTAPPSETPVVVPPPATGSSTLQTLPGTSPLPSAPAQATSAADLLRQSSGQ